MTTPAAFLARTPLRVKLVVAVVLLAALGLVVSGLAASTALHGYLQDRVDSQLQDSVRDRGQLLDALRGDDLRPRRPNSFGTIYVAVAGVSSPLPVGMAPPDLPSSPPTDKPFTVRATSGSREWRAVAVGAPGNELVVAVPLDEVQRTVSRLQVIQIVVGTAVLALLAVVGFLLVRRNLRPLVAVESTAEAIAAGDLSRRVPESDPRTEVGSLSRSVNAMLAQIETAFSEREASEAEARTSEQRMRRFVADASHELRTPLTSIRGFAELYRQGALPTTEDVERAMSRVESEASRMGLLVEDLLMLARLDQQRPLERGSVDLLELAGDAVQDARAIDPSRSIELSLSSPVAPVVVGDEARLRQVLGNLVDNALTHTPPGTPVTVRLATCPGQAVVEVADSGTGIPATDRARVFERFYRADASRTRAQGGSGLGLSIVAALVAAHGGSVEAEDTPGGGATFRVRLPLAPG